MVKKYCFLLLNKQPTILIKKVKPERKNITFNSEIHQEFC